MVIRPEDVSLAEELASERRPEWRAEGFANLSPVEQWARVVASLRLAGYEIRKANDASAGPDFSQAYRRAEPKIRDVLRRLAPPGTAVTPTLISRVQGEIVRVIAGELRASGLPPTAADTLAKLMSAAINIKPAKQA